MEFWLAVEAWNEEQENEWDKIRTQMAWAYNIQPNFSRQRRRPMKKEDVIRLPSDRSKEVPKVSLKDFKRMIEKDKANWDSGNEITLEEFKDANSR